MTERFDKYLVDSNLITYHLNGEDKATKFLKNNISRLSISRVTFIEVMSFEFTEEEKKNVLSLLRQFEILDTTEAIAMQALKNRTLKKIKIADNIIASTAQVNHLILATRNVKDFNQVDLRLLNIFEADVG